MWMIGEFEWSELKRVITVIGNVKCLLLTVEIKGSRTANNSYIIKRNKYYDRNLLLK